MNSDRSDSRCGRFSSDPTEACWPLADHLQLRQAFSDLLEVAEDMRAYVPDYFAEKWRHDEGLEAARAALDERQQP